jgi:uncharacterized protein YbbC (DUF1343 family)
MRVRAGIAETGVVVLVAVPGNDLGRLFAYEHGGHGYNKLGEKNHEHKYERSAIIVYSLLYHCNDCALALYRDLLSALEGK